MLKIKLQRRGRKNVPIYRIIVQEARTSVRGRFIDDLGFFDPKKEKISIDPEKASEWIKKGAKPTETARYVLFKSGVIKEPPPRKSTKPKNKNE